MDDIEELFPEYYLTISSILLSLSALVGIAVNIIVICVVNRAWKFHCKPVYVLVLSGSIASLLLCLTLFPYEALLRLASFRNVIADTPLRYVFCKANLTGFIGSIFIPISNWTNVSIAYNRYAMCRFSLDKYRQKFCRSRTMRWIKCTWIVPMIYGAIVITASVVKGQLNQKNGDPLEQGTFDNGINSTQSPLISILPPLPKDGVLKIMSNENAAQISHKSSQVMPHDFPIKNQTSTSFMPTDNSGPNFGDLEFESFTDRNGLSNSLVTHFEHNIVTDAPNRSILLQDDLAFQWQNTTDSNDRAGQLGHDNTSMSSDLSVPIISGSQKTCPFNPMAVVDNTIWAILVMTFTFVSNIIPNLFALYAMVYVLRRVNYIDNATLIDWTKGTLLFLGIRAMLALPMEIMLLLRLPMFGVSVPFLPFYFMRDLKFLVSTADPFIFGLRLPDFKDFLWPVPEHNE